MVGPFPGTHRGTLPGSFSGSSECVMEHFPIVFKTLDYLELLGIILQMHFLNHLDSIEGLGKAIRSIAVDYCMYPMTSQMRDHGLELLEGVAELRGRRTNSRN